MDSIINLTESRKARHERGELFRNAGKDLLTVLEKQRQHISEEFMTFLLAMAISDQALHYATDANNKKAGSHFLDHLFTTAKQIFDSHYQESQGVFRPQNQMPGQNSRIIDFARAANENSME